MAELAGRVCYTTRSFRVVIHGAERRDQSVEKRMI
jgi:hypothetical protein